MNWSYIAGYGDGEACLLLYISKDKRKHKIKGSQIVGWNISPNWCLTTFDKTTLLAIENFLSNNGIRVAKMEIKRKRPKQLNSAMRLTIWGWKNITLFLNKILPFSIAKKPQYNIFLNELLKLKLNLPLGKLNKRVWTKGKFLEAMGIVDKINSLKCRKRGKYNKRFFKDLWGL